MSEKHNYGVDLLRVCLMLFIILGHLYAHTDIRSLLPFLSSKWLFTWSTQAVTVCAVNCYVIITGYYMSKAKYDSYKLVKLWSKVVFYSILITCILLLLKTVSFSAGVLLDAVFPVLRDEYWFFTNYILLFFFIPFLNVAINNMDNNKHKVLVLISLVVFYIEPLFSVVFYEYDSTEGFSIIAFISLYIIGSYLSRCEDLKIRYCIFLLFGSSIIMVISKVILEMIVEHFQLSFGTGLLYHNNSIFVLLIAVSLFELFKQIKLNNHVQKFVAWITPSIFAVYLIHEKPIMRNLIWNDCLVGLLKDASLFIYVLIVLGISIAILVLCICFDKLLTLIFFKHIEKTDFSKWLKDKCEKYNMIFKS